MKTGFNNCRKETFYPETFHVTYSVLNAILRRSGYKDSHTYSMHNQVVFDQELFETGVIFNLFSDYGVGKVLRPLIKELFLTVELDPLKHRDNIFFREIVRLAPEVSGIHRSSDSHTSEGRWLSNYTINSLYSVDPLSVERDIRLHDLLYNNSNENNCEDTTSEDDETLTDKNNTEDESTDETLTDENNTEEDETSYEDIISDDSDDDSDDETSYEDIISDDSADDSDDEIPSEDIVSNKPLSNNINLDKNSSDNKVNQKISFCLCSFCNEFRKYHANVETRNINTIINHVLTDIVR